MLLHKWENTGPYDFVTISDACKCAVHNHGMRFHPTPWRYIRRKDAAESHNCHGNVHQHDDSRTTVAAVEMKPGFIREKNTCPVLMREMSTSGETCYTMTLLENRTYGWTSWPYASFTQSIMYRSGLILLRPGILLAVKVAVLSRSRRWTTRMYLSWWLDVTRGRPDRGRSLVVPNCWYRLHKAYSISAHAKLSCISMTYTSFNHAFGAPSVSFIQPWHGVSKTFFSKLSWFLVLQTWTRCLYTCLVDKRVCDLTAARKKNVETKTLAKQTNYPCNSCSDQCKWPGWIHNLPM